MTPNENATIYESTFEGARPIAKYIALVSTDSDSRVTYAQLQTGLERPLKAAATYTLLTTPWPKSEAKLAVKEEVLQDGLVVDSFN